MGSVTSVEQPEPKPWAMPLPEVGEVVLFYQDGDVAVGGAPMVVLKVTAPTITGRLQTLETVTMKQSVRHVDDPVLRERPRSKQFGTWDFAGVGKRLRDVETILNDAGLKDAPKPTAEVKK